MVDDVFGRRWRLWLARGEEGERPQGNGASSVIDRLVAFSLNDCRGRHDRAGAILLAIHDRLTGGSLARGGDHFVDLGAARRTADRVSETLGRAAYFGHLRVERAEPLHAGFVVDDAPDTERELEGAPGSTPAPVTDWVGVLVRDEDGFPIPSVRCRITTPGRAPVEATTDSSGRVLLRSVEVGSCVIELPEIDGREWAAGAAT